MSPLWSNTDNAASAPKTKLLGGLSPSSNANGYTCYANTQVNAFVQDLAIGDFGVSPTQVAQTDGSNPYVTHSGWVLRSAGTGPVASISILSGGNDYSTNGFITFSGTGSGANASYTVNATSKVINTVTLNSGGKDYVTAPTANVANANGVNTATFTLTMGGRAGRIQCETLVAQGSMTSSGNATFPLT